MKYALEEITSIKKTLSVEIPEEIVNKEIATAYSNLSRSVRLPGFRKGKAPLSLLENKYRHEVEDDVLKKLIPDYYQKAVEESGIDPIEYPKIENIAIKKNAPLSFKATVEVRPKFDLKNYAGLPLKVQKLSVTDENVDRSVDTLRDMGAQLELVPADHSIVDKDFVTIDFEGFIDGKPMEGGKAEGYPVEIGKKTLIPGFEENLLGLKKGDQVEFKSSLPEGIKPEQNAGKEALFKVHVREIKKKILPELDAEFAKDLGMESIEALKIKLREELVSRFNKERESVLKNEIIKALNGLHEMELPASLVNRELIRIIKSLKMEDVKKEGLLDIEALQKKYEPIARERVKGALILYAISQKENITVSPNDLEEELRLIARENRMAVDEVKKKIVEAEGSLNGIESKLLEDKTLSFLLTKAEIEESEGTKKV
jgi:trigger factor